MIEFTVLGEPVAQGRPRAGKTRKGKTVLYDPQKSRDFKQYVGLVASQHAPSELLEGPLNVKVKVYKPMLKRFSKKRTQEAESGLYRPLTKPDVDNYAKGIKDALNKVIWNDDSQVVEFTISKWYSSKPRIEVEVSELE
ncbi:RusA family crossover junction endodeoxyribonuclease [Halobacillus salinarum]|uniref:RusA family crossover junction endodeoxyribonuclease n=1 Tax=Halobacillus salinarum TaxID=2932257 RepID=A0ABY4EFX0_9BACI|nr:RusA family crossover junction endodeoxyribonuclease [Halobacillus salinarum]UOQ43375.1 RusA family crossover junction endodeoxyribonuclease [Halobacillus salinarum]